MTAWGELSAYMRANWSISGAYITRYQSVKSQDEVQMLWKAGVFEVNTLDLQCCLPDALGGTCAHDVSGQEMACSALEIANIVSHFVYRMIDLKDSSTETLVVRLSTLLIPLCSGFCKCVNFWNLMCCYIAEMLCAHYDDL
ncbi:hypothetical protein K435DRAFT_793290 [Dendrothele bispora CBS 962.96]|uniref:Uncharacterized protein n=1 Tax=Dendrothele bispora (strain CBS 962.96) TaxID=1314807 RepID=A0A4S8MFR2_DENBC|nr:hypothetical protein K435DRAFT_793290 [Dendrothele bispora CBS 962.96]